MITELKNVLAKRRSEYDLSKDTKVSVQTIQESIAFAVKHTPSPFNVQSARVVLLLNEHHTKLWKIVEDELRKVVPAEKFAPTQQKIDEFSKAFGTVLFFEDKLLTIELQNRFPRYKDSFPKWAQQSNGMLQYAVWNLLTALDLGASLQHYNPLIDAEVRKEWQIPENFDLIAQMPFGKVLKKAGEKEFARLDERFFVYQ